MKPLRIVSLIVGCLLAVPAAGMLIGGSALALAAIFARDDDGFFTASIDRLETSTVAISTEDLSLAADPGTPDRLIDSLDLDVRLRVTSNEAGQDVFVGIAPETDVDAYLAGVAHDEIRDIDNDGVAQFRNRTGSSQIAPPTGEDFWTVSTAGPGTQQLDWEATAGRWAAVIMNADGSPGVAVDADVGVKAGFIVPAIVLLLVIGAVLTVIAVGLITAGALAYRAERPPVPAPEGVPSPLAAEAGAAPPTGAPLADRGTPLSLDGQLDPGLSNWQWLVKWFLAIPHFIILFFLWIAFAVLTVVAGVAILFTGRYPRGLFDFNVGVLRWTWRVSFYATSGGIGTDRYPPFSLDDDRSYPATLDVEYPDQLSRGLVLVKWWLLAIPHYVVVAALTGSIIGWEGVGGSGFSIGPTTGGGLLGFLVLVAGVVLLFTSRYPRALFDLIIGINRWVYRVVVYAALMTDRYPPFRLDQGGTEPLPPPVDPAPSPPSSAGRELEEPVGV